MRSAAVIALALLGACNDGSEVNVHIAAGGAMPMFEGVTHVRLGEDGRWEGHVDGSATAGFTSTWQFGHDSGSDTRRLEGIRPGDEIELAGSGPYDLPADCTCATSSAPAVGLITRSTSCGASTCPPPTPNQGTFTTTITRYREAGTALAGPGETLVRCSETTWDELRPTFFLTRCP